MSNHSKPLVSCIITCYNREHCINLAIDSVLYQSYSNIELIIVDDHSTDKSFEIINSYSENNKVIIFRHEENSGLPAISRNTGLKHASGEYIAFLDADDIWSEKKIELQMKILLNRQDDLIAVGSNVRFSHEAPKIKVSEMYTEITLENILLSKSVPLSSIIFRDKQLYFNEDSSFRAVEDLEFQVRLLKYSKKSIYKIGEPLVYYSIEQGSISSDLNNYSNLLNVIDYYKTDIQQETFFMAKHIAYLKLGLKAMKLEIDSFKYFKKSMDFHNGSLFRIFVSIFLLMLSLLPNRQAAILLRRIYSSRKVSMILFEKIST